MNIITKEAKNSLFLNAFKRNICVMAGAEFAMKQSKMAVHAVPTEQS